MPRRTPEDLRYKSIWEDDLIANVLNEKRRCKMWRWLIDHPNARLEDLELLFSKWSYPVKERVSILTEYQLMTTTVVEKMVSERGDCTKLLVELQDGHRVETVVMVHAKHATVCVSSQIGCKMGCKFCATGMMGIIGDLTAGEIIEQLVHANAVTRIRNVVFMGMGEPLNNFENVKTAVKFMIHSERFALSPHQVTVSTVGVLKNMYRLTAELPFVNLALSLHASNQDVRVQIVPTASAHRIDKLMTAVDHHIQYSNQGPRVDCKGRALPMLPPITIKPNLVKPMTIKPTESKNSDSGVMCNSSHAKGKGEVKGEVEGEVKGEMKGKGTNDGELSETTTADDKYWHTVGKRRGYTTTVMIEYILIKNINVLEEHAHELGAMMATRRDHILLNLIPYNPTTVKEDYEPPSELEVNAFHKILTSSPYFIHTRVRGEKGQDIDGACGQLALKTTNSKGGKGEKGNSIDIEDYMQSTRSRQGEGRNKNKGAPEVKGGSGGGRQRANVANDSSGTKGVEGRGEVNDSSYDSPVTARNCIGSAYTLLTNAGTRCMSVADGVMSKENRCRTLCLVHLSMVLISFTSDIILTSRSSALV